ncbi:MAG: hypothetical protein ACP5KW_09410 [Thermoproteota archaeon]
MEKNEEDAEERAFRFFSTLKAINTMDNCIKDLELLQEFLDEPEKTRIHNLMIQLMREANRLRKEVKL